MFASAPFAVAAFGDPPSEPWRALLDADGTLDAGAAVDVDIIAIASTDGTMAGSGNLEPLFQAVREGTATLAADAGLTPNFALVFNSIGMVDAADASVGNGVSLWNAGGEMAGAADMLGLLLRAYDQLFPPIVVNGYVVQIGHRLYTWRSSTARWEPSGPA